LTKPLNMGLTVNLNGKSVWVTFKYEKLPQFCYTCGRIFHAQQSCTDRGGVWLNNDAPAKQWGIWLRADDLRYKKSGPMWADSGPTGSKNGGKASSKDIPNTTHVLHTHSSATCMPKYLPNIHVFYKGHHHRHVQDPLSTSPFSWLFFCLHLAASLMRSDIFQAILHTCLHILVSVSIIVSTCMFIPGKQGTASRTHVYRAGHTYG